MRFEFFLHGLGKVPEGNALWRIEDFTTAKSCDCEYGARLRKIMGAWKSSPDRSSPKATELAAGIPPFGEIHLTNSGHDQSQFQQSIKIDSCLRHWQAALMSQATECTPKPTSGGLCGFPQQGAAISAPSLISGACLLLLNPMINIDALKSPLMTVDEYCFASHKRCVSSHDLPKRNFWEAS